MMKSYSIEEIKTMQIQEIDKGQMLDLVFRNHYSKIMPKLTKKRLGGYIGNDLVAGMTLGWGVRPLHTIKKLFPSLTTTDYYEIGKMVLEEELPRNSESIFISKILDFVKVNYPEILLIYTWADGILGKPGYVYQAANFLYGGHIITDLYIGKNGEKIHPRTSTKWCRELEEETGEKYGRLPDWKLKELNWSHWKGKQFRYVYFTSNKRIKRNLLKSSTTDWSTDYPKENDLTWKVKNYETGKWEERNDIPYDEYSSIQYNESVLENKELVESFRQSKEFFGYQ